jgi:hypothetical protein
MIVITRIASIRKDIVDKSMLSKADLTGQNTGQTYLLCRGRRRGYATTLIRNNLNEYGKQCSSIVIQFICEYLTEVSSSNEIPVNRIMES